MSPELISSLAQTDEPKGSVLLAHGYGEHRGRYQAFIKALNDAGYDTWSFDFTGHGTSPGSRARVDVRKLIGEHLVLRRNAMRESRTDRMFLFGHSMGGLITLASTLLDPTHVVATVVTGPALRPLPRVNLKAAGLGAKVGSLIPALNSVALDVRLLSRDPQVALDYEADPLVYAGKVPLITGASMTLQGSEVLKNAGILARPVLILHGEADGLADLAGSVEFAQKAGDLVEIETFPGAYHELLNELEKKSYTERIITWYDQW